MYVGLLGGYSFDVEISCRGVVDLSRARSSELTTVRAFQQRHGFGNGGIRVVFRGSSHSRWMLPGFTLFGVVCCNVPKNKILINRN